MNDEVGDSNRYDVLALTKVYRGDAAASPIS
jgi:hypothetical protein